MWTTCSVSSGTVRRGWSVSHALLGSSGWTVMCFFSTMLRVSGSLSENEALKYRLQRWYRGKRGRDRGILQCCPTALAYSCLYNINILRGISIITTIAQSSRFPATWEEPNSLCPCKRVRCSTTIFSVHNDLGTPESLSIESHLKRIAALSLTLLLKNLKKNCPRDG